MAEKKLSERQKKFCEFFAANGNATESAKLAGYSEKTARQIGDENLSKPVIQEYLKELTKPAEDKRIADAVERQSLLTAILRGELEDRGEPASLSDKLKAIDMLGRMQGDFTTKTELTGKDGAEFKGIAVVFQEP